MKRIIFLPIEIIERELDAKLLLAAEALLRGYRVYIGHFRKIEEAAFYEKSGFYLYKAMTDYNGEKLFLPLTEVGVITIALDEEGLVWPNLKYYSDTRIGKGIGLKALDLIFTWGDEQRDYILKKYNIPNNKIISTGNPRFDILIKPFIKIYEKDAIDIKKKYGRFVLVNTNFGPANFSSVFGRSWLEHLKWAKIIKNDDDLVYYKDREKYYNLMLESYIDGLCRLAKKISPTKIIVRPHPSEEHSTWRRRLKGFQNIHVVFEGASKPWILSSECVIHSGCTTGIEAFVMGKSVVRYNVTGRDDMESSLPNSISKFCPTYESFEKTIVDTLNKSHVEKNDFSKFEYLRGRIRNISDEFAYIAILNEIDKKYDDFSPTPCEPLKDDGVLRVLRRIISLNPIKKLVISLPYLGGLNLVRKLRLQNQRFAGINERHLLVRLYEIMEELDMVRRHKVLIKKFTNDVYCLELKK